MITLKDYLTSSNKHPEREKDKEVTQTVIDHANILLPRVNALLIELGFPNATVRSGFRPSLINAATPNASKTSHHMDGSAIDVDDPSGKIDQAILLKPHLLEKYDLYLEHPDSTLSWSHYQYMAPRSGKRIFKP